MADKTNIELYNIKTIDENDFLWKFVSIDKFFSIILNKKLYLTRIDSFEDELEGIEPKLLLLNHQKNALLSLPPLNELKSFHDIDIFPEETDKLIDQLKEIQKYNFANCWFLSNKNIESVAMWNLYSQPNSVALNIKLSDFYDNLLRSGYTSRIKLKRLILGVIRYVNFQNPHELELLEKEIGLTPFLKDKSFSHENEFRIIAEIEKYKHPPFKPKAGFSKYRQEEFYNANIQIYGLNIILHEFFDYKFEIVFHPKISKWVKEDLINILERLEVPFKTRDSNLKLK
ncbi:MAG TPA: hypothetical protein VMV56_12665 [Williamwhitmania sp.]|nr:hypothetical protein [Williamwhitmania sp.]